MSDGNGVAERIRVQLAADVAVEGAAARDGFALDGVPPSAVAFPETPEQVAALLALAGAEGWGVVPWGGGSGQGRGRAPARYDVALSLSRLAALHDHDVENLTLTAAAGLTLADANRQVAGQHQMLALGFADAPHTLGGSIAANALAPKRLLYGEVRDQLLGLRVALADGTLVRYGRKVLKNVAGYDMNKLFLGSQGMLGVVVEATFKLFAMPDEERYLLVPFAGEAAALDCAAALYRSQLLPALLLLLDDPAARQAGDALQQPAGDGALHLLLGFEGRTATLQRQLADARTLIARHGGGAETAFERIPPALREVLEAHTPQPGQPAALRLRLGVLPTALGEARSRAEALLAELGLARATVIDYAAGQVRIAAESPAPDAMPELERLAEGLRALREALAPERGYLVLEAAHAALKARVDAFGVSAGEQRLMRTLKQRFDPQDVLAPGRYLEAAP